MKGRSGSSDTKLVPMLSTGMIEQEKFAEFQVLVHCGTGRRDALQQARLRRDVEAGVDWAHLLTLARRHKMTPLLYWHLDRLEEDVVPAQVRAALRRAFLANASWQLRFTGELLEILALFEANEILAVPYKGPTLAVQLYGDVSLRESIDLDILLRREDIVRARELLLERGYRARFPLTEADHAFMLRSRYAETLDGPDGMSVELHWAFTNGDVSFPLTLDDLTPRLERTTLGGASVPTFSSEDLLLILCVHGAKHLWNRLEWVCGIAELVRVTPGLPWDAVLQRAKSCGSERMFLLGIALAHELLEAPVPEAIVARARQDRHVELLLGDVKWLLWEDEVATESDAKYGSLHHDLLHFRLRERAQDQIRYLFYRFTTPSRPERWVALPLGGRAVPLHSVSRPIQVLAKLVPAIWWYVTRKKVRDLPPG